MDSRPKRDTNNASVTRQAVRGSAYTVAASAITVSLGFVRAVLLARFLLPDQFGVVALATFFVMLATRLRSLGFDRALIHKQTTEGPIFETYAAMKTGVVIVTTLMFLAVSPLIAHFYPNRPHLLPVMVALALIMTLAAFNQLQETALQAQLRFRDIALVNISAAIVMTVVAPALAWWGWGVWSLVAEQAVGIFTRGLLVWGPLRASPFRPRLHRDVARWFWEFGKANWVGANVGYLLDRFDDFWVGTTLGNIPLGYYNRAYEFARYPRRLLANSLLTVMAPVFARLQEDRARLSVAYFRVMSLLVRVGILVGGLIVVLAPEFILWFLGAKWQPMTRTFQLMVVYVMLDPLLLTSAHLLLAVGNPRALARARVLQMAFFIPAVIISAALAGIEGVALAADAMLVVGWLLLDRPLRRHVDFSLLRMWAIPLAGMGLGVSLVWAYQRLYPGLTPSHALVKMVIFVSVVGGVMMLGEGKETMTMMQQGWKALGLTSEETSTKGRSR